MGPSWAHLALLGPSWGPPWDLLGPFWAILGPSWPQHFAPILLAPLFDRSWALWGRFGALLGPSWDPFGALWGLSWASWGAPGPLLGLFWRPTWVHAWMYAFIACPLPLPMAWHISLCSYGKVCHKLCCAFFSCSLLHCLPKFLATAKAIHSRPGVALRTATDLMKTCCFPVVFLHLGFPPFTLPLLQS